jgi:hypothetical protein
MDFKNSTIYTKLLKDLIRLFEGGYERKQRSLGLEIEGVQSL